MEHQQQQEEKIEWSMSDEKAGQCNTLAGEIHLLTPFGVFMLVHFRPLDENGRLLNLNKYVDNENENDEANALHTVLLHRPGPNPISWKVCDPTYVKGGDPSMGLLLIPFYEYAKEFVKLYNGETKVIYITWPITEHNMWVCRTGVNSLEVHLDI